MDPITLILAALAAGAAAGGKDLANNAIKDAYHGLKTLLMARFQKQASERGGTDAVHVDPVAVLQAHETRPDTWAAPLSDVLEESRAAYDEDILRAARVLLEQADPHGTAAGKYRLDLRGAQGVQVGDHGQMTNTFGNVVQRHHDQPPPG